MLDWGTVSAKSWAALLDSLRRDSRSGATALTGRAAEALPALVLPAPVRGWAEDAIAGEEAPAPGRDPDVWACLFDLTPLDLLRGIISERGLLTPRNAATLAAVEPVHPWLADLLDR